MSKEAPIVYSVGTKNGHGTSEGGLVYGTVVKHNESGHIGYVIQDRMGCVIRIDGDAIDALIAALVQARGPQVLGLPTTL